MVATRKLNLLVIVGPTASGKSRLAMELAHKLDGEIIAADSRTVYKGMDIGTAKPTKGELEAIAHWGIDLVPPGRPFSAAQFKEYVLGKISEIRNRGKLPILVGGTGLYIDGVLFDFNFIKGKAERAELEKLNDEQLRQTITNLGYEMPQNRHNRRHLIRTLERQGRVGSSRKKPLPGSLLIGLNLPDEELKRNISNRADQMFNSGVIEETKGLIYTFGQPAVESSSYIYKICASLINGEIDKETAQQLFKTADWQYARRQKTWFKRNKFIQWYPNAKVAATSVRQQLNT